MMQGCVSWAWCRGCDHLHDESHVGASTVCCVYILHTGHRRPCPAGEGCTVKSVRGRPRMKYTGNGGDYEALSGIRTDRRRGGGGMNCAEIHVRIDQDSQRLECNVAGDLGGVLSAWTAAGVRICKIYDLSREQLCIGLPGAFRTIEKFMDHADVAYSVDIDADAVRRAAEKEPPQV